LRNFIVARVVLPSRCESCVRRLFRESVVQRVRICCWLSTLLLALAACTSRPVKQEPLPTATTLAAHGIECHKERTTGSLVATTVCTSAAERAHEADATQKTKDWMNNASAGRCPPNVQCN